MNITYYFISGIAPLPEMDKYTRLNQVDYYNVQYVIKAENIEHAFAMFNKLVGHNSFDGFKEFANAYENVPSYVVQGTNNAEVGVWITRQRYQDVYTQIT